MKSDQIIISNIRAHIIIGILPHELTSPQPVTISVTLNTNCLKASQTDNIADAVDYAIIHDAILHHIHQHHYGLIETLAEAIAQLCLTNKAISECTVKVEKPQALASAESVAVLITRCQN